LESNTNRSLAKLSLDSGRGRVDEVGISRSGNASQVAGSTSVNGATVVNSASVLGIIVGTVRIFKKDRVCDS